MAGGARRLRELGFRAETSPHAPGIELVWEGELLGGVGLLILRRERRFPGRSRRGESPVQATPADLNDGTPVFDTRTFQHDFEETRGEVLDGVRVETTRYYLYVGSDGARPPDRILLASVRRRIHPDTGLPIEGSARTRLLDAGQRPGAGAPAAGLVHYYTAFVRDDDGDGLSYSRDTQSSALATARLGTQLFDLLPQIHRRLDTALPAPFTVAAADLDKGQLQRFLEVFGAHADMLHGMVEGLRDAHNPRRADSRLLPALAHLLGWKLKDYLDEDGQRNEIRYAVDVYRILGTPPSVADMVNRLTGWDARVREFARSVLRSFDTARLERVGAGAVAYLDGGPRGPGAPELPAGSVDTRDLNAMYRLRVGAFEDAAAYTYDTRLPSDRNGFVRDRIGLYNRETIAVYIRPDDATELFSVQEEWQRVRQILADFLPIQVRAVFVLDPGASEERYDTLTQVTESDARAIGVLADGPEVYGEGLDAHRDRIPGYRRLFTNDRESRSVNTGAAPVDTGARTWHTAIDYGP